MVTSVNGELSGRRISVDGEQAWTENKRGRRKSVDGEKAWTENKRGRSISVAGLRPGIFLKISTHLDVYEAGTFNNLEALLNVDLNKAWT